jgi:hypothetical protein
MILEVERLENIISCLDVVESLKGAQQPDFTLTDKQVAKLDMSERVVPH